MSTKNNIEILANESTYDKTKLVLSLNGNIKVNDRENNIIIESDNVTYYKNIEEIIYFHKREHQLISELKIYFKQIEEYHD